MPIPFNAPDGLIRDYLNQPSPADQANAGIQQALQTYAAMKMQNQKSALLKQEADRQNQELALKQQAETRAQDQYGRQYNPASLPGAGGAYNQFSPADYGAAGPALTGDAQTRALLTESGGPATLDPTLGQPPAAAAPGPRASSPVLDHWHATMGSGIGMGSNPGLAAAPRTPQEQANLEFANQNPMGLMATDKKMNQDLQASEVAKNNAQAELYRKGGASGGKGTWKLNQFTGQYDFYPNNPSDAGGAPGAPAPGAQPSVPTGRPAGQTPLPFHDQAKLDREKPKAYGSLQNTLKEYDNMIKEAEAIKSDPSLGSATGMLSPLTHVPGTGAKRVSSRLETLKAKTLLNVLGSLKNLSATGASGFGALSNTEGENIRNSVSSLDNSVATPDFVASLDRFITDMKDKRGLLGQTFIDTYGDPGGLQGGMGAGGGSPQGAPQSAPMVTSQAQYDALPSGADYVSADGAPHRKK